MVITRHNLKWYSRERKTRRQKRDGACKGNCGLKKCLKHCMHLRTSKSTSRGSEDIQLHYNKLEHMTYLAEDPKRKE